MEDKQKIRIIISGGGTGGHIFPAISIADEIRRVRPDTEILFVGALGRMEMERVPKAGYKIIGLPISGLQRRLSFKNVEVLINLVRSLRQSRKIITDFNPHIAVGVGGYASGPVLRSAARKGIPTLLQEQNSYAGVTNKLLAKKALKICVAYPGMEKYFPADKIILTGNPVRALEISPELKKEGMKHFELDHSLPVLAILGGSLGARSINEAMLKALPLFTAGKIQVIWQTGKYYYEEMQGRISGEHPLLKVEAFIARMDLLYNVANLVVSRAGAISISELCLAGQAALLVPSPNVAEDHQTKNAMALVDVKAAEMLRDRDAMEKLGSKAIEMLNNTEHLDRLSKNIKRLAKPDATRTIVNEVFKLVEGK